MPTVIVSLSAENMGGGNCGQGLFHDDSTIAIAPPRQGVEHAAANASSMAVAKDSVVSVYCMVVFYLFTVSI